MKVVIKTRTDKGAFVAEVDWDRGLLMDFGEAFKRAAMFLGDQTLIIDMSRAGVRLDVQSEAPRFADSGDTMQ